MSTKSCWVERSRLFNFIPSRSLDLLDQQKIVLTYNIGHIITPVPGWTEYLKESYVESRMAFQEWKFHGRPHQCPVYEGLKLTRSRLKYTQRSVEKNPDTL